MPEWKQQDLMKSWKAHQILPFYLLYGAEQYPLEQFLKELTGTLVAPSFAEFNLQRFDETATLNDVQTAYEALPMMAEYKCVLLRNFPVGSLGKADAEALFSMIADPNPSTVLVFYYTDTEFSPKKAQEKALVKAVSKQGTVVQFATQDAAALAKNLAAYAKGQHVAFPADAAALLIERCGASYQELLSETQKLIAYTGEGGTITKEAVIALTSQSFQNSAFDLCNALVFGRAAQAFVLLGHLYDQRVEPMMILGALASAFGDLYRAKAGQAARIPQAQIVSDFHYGRASFRITKYGRNLSSYSIERIRFCIQVLMDTNRRMLTGQADDRLALEEAISRMLSFGRAVS